MDYSTKTPNELYAKIYTTIDNRILVLSVEQHLRDVMDVGEYLWKNIIDDSIKTQLQSYVPKAKSVFLFICAIHDLGKYSIDFQNKLFNLPSSIDHVTMSFTILHTIFGKKIDKTLVTESIRYHHGYQGEFISQGNLHKMARNILCFDWIKNTYIPNLLGTLGLTEQDILIPIDDSTPFQIRECFSGWLIASDWIASNSKLYKYHPIEYKKAVVPRRNNEELSKQLPKLLLRDIPITEKFYTSVFGFSPNFLQQKILDLTHEDIQNKRLAILEAPTGYGKTEAALSLAYRYMQDCGKNGIYLSMPTRITSNALYNRANSFLNKITEDGYENSFLLHHSKSELFLESLKKESMDGELFDSPVGDILKYKLTNINPFIVGTVDNLLTLPFGIKHFPLTHVGLFNKVYIIDEIHSYDTRMFRILCEVLSILSLLHVPVILLSATLPLSRKEELMQSYTGTVDYDKVINLDLYKCGQIAPKNVTVHLNFQTQNCMVDYTPIPDRDYELDSDEEKETYFLEEEDPTDTLDAHTIENYIKSQISTGLYGVVVNTVQRAQSLYDILSHTFGKEHCTLLHSRYDSTQRGEIENKVLHIFGKGGYQERKNRFHILIATQIVEQSIDIDFDCLFTDICPMDSLIQRIGRLHRHSRNNSIRPKSLVKPNVYILQTYIPSDGDLKHYFNKKSLFIYGKYILYATRLVLMENLTNRTDIDFTVETPKLVNAIFACFNKVLFGEYLNEAYSKWKSTEDKCRNGAIQNFLHRPINNGYEETTLFADPDKGFIGIERHKVKVRDITPTLEVAIVFKDELSGNYYTCYDNSKVDATSYSDLMRHTVTLPQGVTRSIAKDSLDTLPIQTENNIRDLQTPALIFKSIENGRTDEIPVPCTTNTEYALWYHRELGLRVEKRQI